MAMKQAMSAALLNLLVFPGTGHILLKRIKTGMAIMAISLACLAAFIVEIFKVVWHMLQQVNYGQATDMPGLTALVHQQITHSNSGLLHISLTLLLVFWLGSVIDALRIGLAKKAG